MSTLKVNNLQDTSGNNLSRVAATAQNIVTATSSATISSLSSLVDTPATVTITSTLANSKFLVSGMVVMEANASDDHDFALVMRRIIGGSGTSICVGTNSGNRPGVTRNWDTDGVDDSGSTASMNIMPTFLDSPAQAAGTAITYTYSMMATDGTPSWNVYFNRTVNDNDSSGHERFNTFINVLEIAV
tara:strand:- start:555 stop:1115 length:561 start_codon:yes stop_codon:yes gene_type:complete